MDEPRDKDGLTESEFLARYRGKAWPAPYMTADNVILSRDGKGLRVLLIKRGGHPCLGKWALPGGFVEEGETVQEAARRELMEETGLKSRTQYELGVWSTPGRDPRHWIITDAFLTVTGSDTLERACAGDDAADAAVFDMSAAFTAAGAAVLTLTSGKDSLRAGLHCKAVDGPAGPVYEIKQNAVEGIAFDHAEILLKACLLLGEVKPVTQPSGR